MSFHVISQDHYGFATSETGHHELTEDNEDGSWVFPDIKPVK